MAVAEHVGHRIDQVFHHVRVRQIQHKLVAALRGFIFVGLDRPVGVCTIQIAVGRHHFRLHPKAELEAHGVDLFGKAVDAGGQLLFVDRPIAERALIVVAFAEPAVVEHKQLRADVLGGLRDAENLLFVKVEIGRFPVVDEDRTVLVLPIAAHDVFFDERVHVLAHAVESPVGEGHDAFGRVKALVGFQQPVEFKRVDTVLDAQQTVGRYLGAGNVVAGIDKVKAVAFALQLGAVVAFDGKKRVVAVGTGARDRADGGDAGCEGMLVFIPFADPRAVEGQHRIIAALQIKLHAHQRFDMDGFFALVAEAHAARDDIAVFKHGIKQLQLGAENLVDHHDGQRLAVAVGGRQTVQLGLLIHHKGAVKQKVGGEIVVRGEQIHRRQPVVALAVGGIFKRDMVEREGGVLLGARRRVAVAGFVLVI